MMSRKHSNTPHHLLSLTKKLEDKVLSRQEIIKILHEGLVAFFENASISIYFLDPITNDIEDTYPQHNAWKLPNKEKSWILHNTAHQNDIQKENRGFLTYIKSRQTQDFTDFTQLKRDIQDFEYNCDDYLILNLTSEEPIQLGIIIIHQWESKRPVFADPSEYDKISDQLNSFIASGCMALDNLHIHKKIESLLSDKHQLKMRIQKDEEDLKRRVLELTALYDTSTAIGNALNYQQIITFVMDALVKTLEFDLCSIFLKEFIPSGEIISRINIPLTTSAIHESHKNLLNSIKPFIKEDFCMDKIKISYHKNYSSTQIGKHIHTIQSFANVPLIFKEEVIGMLNLCSQKNNAFPKSEMPFIHTMANQLAANLGRLKIVKDLEHSKINSLIECMDDGVIFIDEHNRLKIINPIATLTLKNIINIEEAKKSISSILETLNLSDLYATVSTTQKPILNQKVTIEENSYSVNISPVLNEEAGFMGTVIVFRNITELERNDRIKTQRLEVISKVNLILKSITDLNNLLTVLMEFILNIAHAEMGSIQLKQDKVFFSKIHSNFPDKIRRFYKFTNGMTISEQVIKNKEILYIDDYKTNPHVSQNVKILIDSYLCIPIMVKNELIGLVNIARKSGNTHVKLSEDDINTLATITTLSGTAIQNAILYQETISRQKLDQELKVATQIQSKLLPETLPELNNVLFGAISIPAREIGGDYYDFFRLENGKIGIVVADIVGKGIPAGLFMAMLKSILHTHFSSHASPKKALTKVNDVLLKDPVINKFVPLFYAILDPENHTLKYCNAGHEPALFFSNGKATPLETGGFPLGAIENPGYEEKKISLSPNDIIMILTDGAIEARMEDGTNFGYSKIKDIILSKTHEHPQNIVDDLLTQIKTQANQQDQHDDITLVAIKIVENHDTRSQHPIKIKEITVTSSKENVKLIRHMTEKICTSMGFSNEDTFYIKLAINEAQANVIEHAYFGSDEGEIYFKFMIYQDKLDILIKDYGPGMDQRTIKGNKEHLSELEGSGLGVFLIKNTMDDIQYNRKSNGTELFLSKQLKKEDKKDGNN